MPWEMFGKCKVLNKRSGAGELSACETCWKSSFIHDPGTLAKKRTENCECEFYPASKSLLLSEDLSSKTACAVRLFK